MKTNSLSVKSNDFRKILQAELKRRSQRGHSYSMRAFARSLSIDQALLSRLIKGERRITPKMIVRLGQALNLSGEQLKKTLQHQAISISARSSGYKPLLDEDFEILSEWLHFAILELIQTVDFQSQSHWVAKRLRVTINEVNMAVERLVKRGLMTIDENGIWNATSPAGNTWTNTQTTEARKRLQKEILKEAVAKIDSTDFSLRENSSLTIAVNKKLIPEIKKRIQDFKNGLREFVEDFGDNDEVYQLAIAFFPLTEMKRKFGGPNEKF
jgi:plasmid maintenance system antidote protein VapI